jgi:hypothetical protein
MTRSQSYDSNVNPSKVFFLELRSNQNFSCKSNLSRSFSEELDFDLGALTLGASPAEDLDDACQRDLLVHRES